MDQSETLKKVIEHWTNNRRAQAIVHALIYNEAARTFTASVRHLNDDDSTIPTPVMGVRTRGVFCYLQFKHGFEGLATDYKVV